METQKGCSFLSPNLDVFCTDWDDFSDYLWDIPWELSTSPAVPSFFM